MKAVYFDTYDVMVNPETGEILDMCKCESGTCGFKDLWISHGSPTHVDLKKL